MKSICPGCYGKQTYCRSCKTWHCNCSWSQHPKPPRKRYVTAGMVKEVRYQDPITGGTRHRLIVKFYPPKPLFQIGETVHIVCESLEETTREAKKRLEK